ncbi:MAG TPA: SIMPL domain-containing protein [Nitrososphaerales archaeon]|nr:SIMPL domain-containing protein [Nitrososphaerales archaeon]
MSISQISGKIVGVSLIIAVLAVAFLGMVAYSATTGKASQADTGTLQTVTTSVGNTPSTITVTGTGIASAIPDEISVVLGVANTGTNATQVLLANSGNMTAAINAIEKNVGINATDVQTTNFNFGPTYSQYGNTINGYQASNQIQVTLEGSEVAELDAVINAAVNAGANQIQSIQYVLSNTLQSTLQNQALQNAISSANQTALLTAQSEGLKVVGIQSVTILGNNNPQPYGLYASLAPAVSASTSINYNVPISPGQTQYTEEVQVVYLVS